MGIDHLRDCFLRHLRTKSTINCTVQSDIAIPSITGFLGYMVSVSIEDGEMIAEGVGGRWWHWWGRLAYFDGVSRCPLNTYEPTNKTNLTRLTRLTLSTLYKVRTLITRDLSTPEAMILQEFRGLSSLT